MKEHDTFPGKSYAITSRVDCTLFDDNGMNEPLKAGKQHHFTAQTSKVYTTEPSTITASNFKIAFVSNGSGGEGVEIKFDTTPTQNSTNAVTSGGVYDVCFARFLKLGLGAKVVSYSLALGEGANAASYRTVAIGEYAEGKKNGAIAIGSYTKAEGAESISMGRNAKVKDDGVFGVGILKADMSTQTYFYVIGAGSPLANTYEDGAACLGYAVKDLSGNILECGTRKLSELLTNHGAFAPAALDLDAPAPTPFLPTGIMEPIEFPENLSE